MELLDLVVRQERGGEDGGAEGAAGHHPLLLGHAGGLGRVSGEVVQTHTVHRLRTDVAVATTTKGRCQKKRAGQGVKKVMAHVLNSFITF